MAEWELGRETRFFNGTLRKLRESKGLSQTEVAEALGVGKATYCAWERMRNVPIEKYRPRIEEFFQKPFEEIFPEFVGEMRTQRTKVIDYAPLDEHTLSYAQEEQRLLGEVNDDPQKIAEQKMAGEFARQIMKEVLSEREQKILTMRFGLDGSSPQTLEETGHFFSVTRDRIRQIEKRALEKLRNRIKDSLCNEELNQIFN